MYNAYFGFREKPFKLVPNPEYLFLSKSHEEALAHLNYAISQGDGFVEITGEVGTGKTTLCRPNSTHSKRRIGLGIQLKMNAQPLKNPLFFIIAHFAAEGDFLKITQLSDPADSDTRRNYSFGLQLPSAEIEKHLNGTVVSIDLHEISSLPPPLTAFPRQLGCVTAAYVPIMQDGQLRGLVLIGARDGQELTDDVVQSYARTIHLITMIVNRQTPHSEPNERDATEVRALEAISASAATIHDLQVFYGVLHDQVRSVVGDHGFLIAFYDQRTNSISVPYLFEEGKLSHIDAFPVGEGLTSFLIRTREPLLLVEDTKSEHARWAQRLPLLRSWRSLSDGFPDLYQNHLNMCGETSDVFIDGPGRRSDCHSIPLCLIYIYFVFASALARLACTLKDTILLIRS